MEISASMLGTMNHLPIAIVALLLPLACTSGKGEGARSSGGARIEDDGGLPPGRGDAWTDRRDGGIAMPAGPAVENAGANSRDRLDGAPGDSDLIVPQGLTLTALPGGNGVLELIALTLRRGPGITELYIALKNTGDIPACSAAVSVELFDNAGQSLAAGIGGLLTERFYRLTDGSGTIAACVGPGDVTMAAVPGLPTDIVIGDVSDLVYRSPYFALDVVSIDGLTVSEVTSATAGAQTAYVGRLVNRLEVSVHNPSVTVFALNRVGRPLGVAIAMGVHEVAPGGSWAFETGTVRASGTDYAAYPAGALGN